MLWISQAIKSYFCSNKHRRSDQFWEVIQPHTLYVTCLEFILVFRFLNCWCEGKSIECGGDGYNHSDENFQFSLWTVFIAHWIQNPRCPNRHLHCLPVRLDSCCWFSWRMFEIIVGPFYCWFTTSSKHLCLLSVHTAWSLAWQLVRNGEKLSKAAPK